jgi:hypothetical protein
LEVTVMHAFHPHHPLRRIDPLLALSGLLCLAGTLTFWLFSSELGALRALGAAPLYLLVLPASLVLGRLRQLRPPARSAAARVPTRSRAMPLRRPSARRQRLQHAGRRAAA